MRITGGAGHPAKKDVRPPVLRKNGVPVKDRLRVRQRGMIRTAKQYLKESVTTGRGAELCALTK